STTMAAAGEPGLLTGHCLVARPSNDPPSLTGTVPPAVPVPAACACRAVPGRARTIPEPRWAELFRFWKMLRGRHKAGRLGTHFEDHVTSAGQAWSCLRRPCRLVQQAVGSCCSLNAFRP